MRHFSSFTASLTVFTSALVATTAFLISRMLSPCWYEERARKSSTGNSGCCFACSLRFIVPRLPDAPIFNRKVNNEDFYYFCITKYAYLGSQPYSCNLGITALVLLLNGESAQSMGARVFITGYFLTLYRPNDAKKKKIAGKKKKKKKSRSLGGIRTRDLLH